MTIRALRLRVARELKTGHPFSTDGLLCLRNIRGRGVRFSVRPCLHSRATRQTTGVLPFFLGGPREAEQTCDRTKNLKSFPFPEKSPVAWGLSKANCGQKRDERSNRIQNVRQLETTSQSPPAFSEFRKGLLDCIRQQTGICRDGHLSASSKKPLGCALGHMDGRKAEIQD